MPKNSIRDYDATADNNTDIQSVDIDENCSPAGINNAIREVMADMKDVSSGTVALESPQADSFTVTGDLTVDTNTLFVDASANSVGIGGTDIEAPLHVLAENSHGINAIFGAKDFIDNASYNYDDANIALQGRDTGNNDTGAGIQFTVRNSGNTNWLHGYAVMPQDGSFAVGTGGAGTTAATERVRIDSSGNVGIGTSSPAATIDAQSSSSDAFFFRSSNATTTNFYLTNTNATTNNTANFYFAPANNVAGAFIRSQAEEDFSVSANRTANVQFHTRNNGTFSEAMRITPSGNVGIGATSPSDLLEISGSTAQPAIRLTDEDVSGLYHRIFTPTNAGLAISADTGNVAASSFIRFDVDGSEKVRLDSSGNVGIGTSSPSEGIHLSRSNATALIESTDGSQATLDLKNTEGHFIIGSNAGSLFVYDQTDGAERMRIASGGNVGIGTSSPARQLTVSNSGAALLLLESTGNDNGQLLFGDSASGTVGKVGYHHSTNHMFFNTNDSEAMRIDSSGNLLVGKTSNDFSTEGCILRPNGDVLFTRSGGDTLTLRRNTSNGGIVSFRRDASQVGTITVTTSSTAYNTSSDRRLKENIADADDAGSKFDALQVRKFDWIADGTHQPYGLIAQELEEIEPLAVSTDDTEDAMKSVDYSKLVPMLIKEVQSLRARVAELENA